MKNAKLVFTGSVWTFLGMTFGISILGLMTLGFGFMVLPFFQLKYMIENTHVEFEDQGKK